MGRQQIAILLRVGSIPTGSFMMIGAGQAFMFVFLYLIALLAARASQRPFYKRMWRVAATVLGVVIVLAVAWYMVGLFGVLMAL